MSQRMETPEENEARLIRERDEREERKFREQIQEQRRKDEEREAKIKRANQEARYLESEAAANAKLRRAEARRQKLTGPSKKRRVASGVGRGALGLFETLAGSKPKKRKSRAKHRRKMKAHKKRRTRTIRLTEAQYRDLIRLRADLNR